MSLDLRRLLFFEPERLEFYAVASGVQLAPVKKGNRSFFASKSGLTTVVEQMTAHDHRDRADGSIVRPQGASLGFGDLGYKSVVTAYTNDKGIDAILERFLSQDSRACHSYWRRQTQALPPDCELSPRCYPNGQEPPGEPVHVDSHPAGHNLLGDTDHPLKILVVSRLRVKSGHRRR